MSPTERKRAFWLCSGSECPDRTAQLTKLLDTTECINREQTPG